MIRKVRRPYVAGQFYEGNAGKLKSCIEQMVANSTVKPSSKRIRAVILPHAGMSFSGQVAVDTLMTAAGSKYSKMVVIAPSHRIPFKGLALADYSLFNTPLGDIKADIPAIQALAEVNPAVMNIMSRAHEYEHSLEVELPLLQELFPEAELIPGIAGFIDEKTSEMIAEALFPHWNEDTLWVISSDFTHYGFSFQYIPFKADIPENLEKLDMGAVDKILDVDLHGFGNYVHRTGATICGAAPIKVLLATIRKSINAGNGISGKLVSYTTSGKLTGDYSHCVSYAGISFCDE